jgi:hypothetical protein
MTENRKKKGWMFVEGWDLKTLENRVGLRARGVSLEVEKRRGGLRKLRRLQRGPGSLDLAREDLSQVLEALSIHRIFATSLAILKLARGKPKYPAIPDNFKPPQTPSQVHPTPAPFQIDLHLAQYFSAPSITQLNFHPL